MSRLLFLQVVLHSADCCCGCCCNNVGSSIGGKYVHEQVKKLLDVIVLQTFVQAKREERNVCCILSSFPIPFAVHHVVAEVFFWLEHSRKTHTRSSFSITSVCLLMPSSFSMPERVDLFATSSHNACCCCRHHATAFLHIPAPHLCTLFAGRIPLLQAAARLMGERGTPGSSDFLKRAAGHHDARFHEVPHVLPIYRECIGVQLLLIFCVHCVIRGVVVYVRNAYRSSLPPFLPLLSLSLLCKL